MRLTEAGCVLADHAGEPLWRMERAKAEIAPVGKAVSGVVRVGAFQSAAIELLPAAWSAWSEPRWRSRGDRA